MQCNNALERIVNHRGRTVHAMKHRPLRVAICAQGLMGCKNVDVAECTEDVQLSDGRNILVFTAGQCARQWLSQCEKGRRYRQCSLRVPALACRGEHFCINHQKF